MTAGELVSVQADGPVCTVRLRREAKLNALSTELEARLLTALTGPQVLRSRAVVLTGGPRAFSAGADVTELGGDPGEIFAYYQRTGRVYETLAGLPMPTVAAIQGYCLGGGLELALAADFRVAGRSAAFGFPEVRIGIVPSSGGLARAVRLLGPARAREVVLLRERFGATDALRYGLVSEMVEDDDVPGRASEMAATLAELPALATTVALRGIDAVGESSHAAALLLEQLAYGMLGQTPEARAR